MAPASITTYNGPSPPTPVSWQTAFLGLVPLALNAMTQPCGRVCGLPSRYLRSSPFLCAGDALSIIFRLVFVSAYLRLPLREVLGLVLHDRFDDYSDEDNREDGIQSLERLTWFRWLFFVLGGLPMAIKLGSMQGVPWTLAYGMMCLVSFLVVEAVAIFATFNRQFFTISASSRVSWPGYTRVVRGLQFRKARVILWLSNALVACLIHISVLLWAYRPLLVFWVWRSFESVLLCTTLCLIICALFIIYVPSYEGQCYFMLSAASLSGMIAPGLMVILFVPLRLLPYLFSIPALGLPLVFIMNSLGLAGLVGLVGFGVPSFGNGLLLIKETSRYTFSVLIPERWRYEMTIDRGALLSLTLFLYSLIISLLWYCYVYDEADTVNPGWTNIWWK
jgi:hypothetical protein